MNYLCYDLGLDPIEMGNTLAMLAEATDRGLVRDGVAWGDAARFEALIRQAGTQDGEWARLGLRVPINSAGRVTYAPKADFRPSRHSPYKGGL